MIKTTVLVGADGRMYSMANANPNIPYVGIAGEFVVNHPHWGVTQIYSSPLIAVAATIRATFRAATAAVSR
jgi:hypothetical protein